MSLYLVGGAGRGVKCRGLLIEPPVEAKNPNQVSQGEAHLSGHHSGLSRGARARWTEDSNLTARDFVPMSTLLQHCAAIVHHGGIGTAALAFAAGIPQVVTPFAHDQFDNAQRVAKSGCGLRIDGPASGRALAAAIKRVTTDPQVARYCAHSRRLLDRSPNACDMAARYIEDVAWLGVQRAA